MLNFIVERRSKTTPWLLFLSYSGLCLGCHDCSCRDVLVLDDFFQMYKIATVGTPTERIDEGHKATCMNAFYEYALQASKSADISVMFQGKLYSKYNAALRKACSTSALKMYESVMLPLPVQQMAEPKLKKPRKSEKDAIWCCVLCSGLDVDNKQNGIQENEL